MSSSSKLKGASNHNVSMDSKPICNFVDLLVGGYRMRYPFHFVLLCEEDMDMTLFNNNSCDLVQLLSDANNLNLSSPPNTADFSLNILEQEFPQSPPTLMEESTLRNDGVYTQLSHGLFGTSVKFKPSKIKSFPDAQHISTGNALISPKKCTWQRKIFSCHGSMIKTLRPLMVVKAPPEWLRSQLADNNLYRGLTAISLTRDDKKTKNVLENCSIIKPSKADLCSCSRISFGTNKIPLNQQPVGYHRRNSANKSLKRKYMGEVIHELDAKMQFIQGGSVGCAVEEVSQSINNLDPVMNLNNIIGGGLNSQQPSGMFTVAADDPLMPTLSPQQPAPGKETHNSLAMPSSMTGASSLAMNSANSLEHGSMAVTTPGACVNAGSSHSSSRNPTDCSVAPPAATHHGSLSSANSISTKEEPRSNTPIPTLGEAIFHQPPHMSTSKTSKKPTEKVLPMGVVRRVKPNPCVTMDAHATYNRQIEAPSERNVSNWLISELRDHVQTESFEDFQANFMANVQPAVMDQYELEDMGIEFGSSGYDIQKTSEILLKRSGLLSFQENKSKTQSTRCPSEFQSVSASGSAPSQTAINNKKCQPHGPIGVSLSSSTGSGSLGPTELALMLPTPPSQESQIQCSESSPLVVAPTSTCHVQSNVEEEEPDVVSLVRRNLYAVAKMPITQEALDIMQSPDWSFLRPHVIYSNILGRFQATENEIMALRHVNNSTQMHFLGYDHRLITNDPPVPAHNPSSSGTIPPVPLGDSASVDTTLGPNAIKPCKRSTPPNFSPGNLNSGNGRPRMNFNIHASLGEDPGSGQSVPSNCDILAIVGEQMGNQTSMGHVKPLLELIDKESRSNALLLKSVHQVLTTLKSNHLDSDSINSILPVSGLKFNLILQDSFLNLFRDHNFDSCNICECTSSVWGKEIGLYLPTPPSDFTALANLNNSAKESTEMQPPSASVDRMNSFPDDPFIRDLVPRGGKAANEDNLQSCKCGFSAIMNQRLATNANLFYEDELEVTCVNLVSVISQDVEFQPLISASPINSLVLSKSNPVPEDTIGGLLGSPYSMPPSLLCKSLLHNGTAFNSLNSHELSEREGNGPRHHVLVDDYGSRACARYLRLIGKWTRCPTEVMGSQVVNSWLTSERQSSGLTVKESMMEFKETCALVMSALKQSAPTNDNDSNAFTTSTDTPKKTPIRSNMCDDHSLRNGIFVHPAFVFKNSAKEALNYSDQLLLLNMIRPLLQDAISSTRQLDANYTVDGPLTWKLFHQLAYQGANETCKPQPIPQLRVNTTVNATPIASVKPKENLLIAPFALQSWEHLGLSPLCKPKRISYAVVHPSGSLHPSCVKQQVKEEPSLMQSSDLLGSPLLVNHLREYFVQLTSMYEACQLGHHSPYYQPYAMDPSTAFITVECQTMESINLPGHSKRSWHPQMPVNYQRALLAQLNEAEVPNADGILAFISSYLENACMSTLKSLLHRGISKPDGEPLNKLFPIPNEQDSVGVEDKAFNLSYSNSKNSPRNGRGHTNTAYDTSDWATDEDTYLMIYIIEPFSYLIDLTSTISKVLLQYIIVGCVQKIEEALPKMWLPRVNFQLLSLSHIASLGSSQDYIHRMSTTALAVYNQIDRFVRPSLVNANRTLTGFGPSAEKEVTSADFELAHARNVYSPAYLLKSYRDFWGQWEICNSEPLDLSSVLFVSYCLTEDQQWLLAACTDECGSLVHETAISLQLPSALISWQANGFKSTSNTGQFSVRRMALAKLWEYICAIIGGTCTSWRLVVGKLGRLGHGELKGWNGLLNRSNLQNVNLSFRKNCALCGYASKATATSSTENGGGTRSSSYDTSRQSKANSTSAPVSNTSARPTFNLTPSDQGNGVVNSCIHDLPSIVSACLISLEPQSTFQVFFDKSGLCIQPNANKPSSSRGGPSNSAPTGLTKFSSVGSGLMANTSTTTGASTAASAQASASFPVPLKLQGLHLQLPCAAPLVSHFPSITHILVFPTSTSASGHVDQECESFNFNDFMFNCGGCEMSNTFDPSLLNNLDAETNLEPGGLLPSQMAPTPPQSSNSQTLSRTPNAMHARTVSIVEGLPLLPVHDGVTSLSVSGATGARQTYKSEVIKPGTLHEVRLEGETLQLLSSSQAKGDSESTLWQLVNHLAGQLFSGSGNRLPLGIPDPQNSDSSFMQQPIAMGYYVSTAPADMLPNWFWASCPHAQLTSPVCLKSALHLKYSLMVGLDESGGAPPLGDQPTPGQTPAAGANSSFLGHALDSNSTCDVLRFVLESYNSLSWLTMNPLLNDRASCLPLHIHNLAQLYKSVSTL